MANRISLVCSAAWVSKTSLLKALQELRVIQREVLDKLSLDILDGKFAEGDAIMARAGKDGVLEFRKG